MSSPALAAGPNFVNVDFRSPPYMIVGDSGGLHEP
jgi:hypothetical protein